MQTVQIDDQLIEYLEELSRLELTEAERADTKANLGRILEHIDTLGQLDTDPVEALSHPFAFTNRFREDEVAPSFDRDLILAAAPERKDGCFRVPKTVE